MVKLFLEATSFIKPDDAWILWGGIIVIAALSIFLEQRYKWAGRLSGPVVALLFSVSLANLNIFPTASPVYDNIGTYLVPVAIAMLLFKADLRKIVKDTGQAFVCFLVGTVGTLIGVVIAFLCVGFFEDAAMMSGVMTGSYVGGGVNFFAIIESLNPSQTIVSATVVADNFVMALAFLVGMTIPGMAWARKAFKHPHEDIADNTDIGTAKTRAAAFWGKKEISLLELATTIAVAFTIATVAVKIADLIGAYVFTSGILNMIFANKFVILTLCSVVLSSSFPKFFGETLKGGDEIGTFVIYLYFVTFGFPASLWEIIRNAPIVFVFCGIIAAINILVLLLGAKVFKLNIEESMLASNATLGGPSSAAAMAIAKGWNNLVVPGILVGLFGYIIGTPLGLLMYEMLKNWR